MFVRRKGSDMTELYIVLAIWAFVGIVSMAIIIASPPWSHAFPEWAQITITVISGPMVWICIACLAILVLMNDGPEKSDSGKSEFEGG